MKIELTKGEWERLHKIAVQALRDEKVTMAQSYRILRYLQRRAAESQATKEK